MGERENMRRRMRALVTSLFLLCGFALTGAAVTSAHFTEFSTPTHISRPSAIAAGPDGNMWFTEEWPETHKIGRITPSGEVTEFPFSFNANLNSIVAGPDGNLWFTDGLSDVGRITPTGEITTFTVPGSNDRQTDGIAVGPDGNLWFGEVYPDAIGRITTSGEVTEYVLPAGGGRPVHLTAGPDGNVWFTQYESDAIGRITPAGKVTEFPFPTNGNTPFGIAVGPDENLWFTERQSNKIGRITTSGEVTEFPLPQKERGAEEIVAGPDGSLWFTEAGAGRIGRITTSGKVTEYPIPTTNSVPYGIAVGPDGNIWFTEWLADKIGWIGTEPMVPENIAPPWISGTPQQGETLSASPGAWSNDPISYAFQWESCDGPASCFPISGAETSSYRPTGGDVGQEIRVRVIAGNDDGPGEPAFSARTETVTPAPEPPLVDFEWVTGVSPSNATLHARINPRSLEKGAYYQFQIAGVSGRFPSEFTPTSTLPMTWIPPRFGDRRVQADLAGEGLRLRPGTTYRYRVIAARSLTVSGGIGWENPITYGPAQAFSTPCPSLRAHRHTHRRCRPRRRCAHGQKCPHRRHHKAILASG